MLLMFILIALAVLSAHALERHGSAAVSASQCADRPELRMVNPETGRIAFVCLTERGWGIYIQARDGGNVSAFIKEKMSRIEQVVRYLENRGYTVVR